MFNLLHKDYFALDISDSSLEVVKLSSDGQIISVWARLEIEPGLVSQGKIVKTESLVIKIKELLRQAKPTLIEIKFAVSHLPDSQTYLHILKVPKNLNQVQIKRIIDNEIDSFFPFAKEELYWQNHLLSSTADHQEILVAASPKEIIDGYLKLFKLLEVRLLALGIAPESIARLLIKDYNISEAVLLVDIGQNSSTIALFDEKGIRNSTSIRVAGSNFTEAVAKGLGVALEEAEQIKIKDGFKDGVDTRAVLESASQPLIIEIKKIIAYHKAQTGHEIKKMILTGGGSNLVQIDLFLASNLGISVDIGQPWLKFPAKANVSIYAPAVGLALIYQPEYLTRSINFLTKSGTRQALINFLNKNSAGKISNRIKQK